MKIFGQQNQLKKGNKNQDTLPCKNDEIWVKMMNSVV